MKCILLIYLKSCLTASSPLSALNYYLDGLMFDLEWQSQWLRPFFFKKKIYSLVLRNTHNESSVAFRFHLKRSNRANQNHKIHQWGMCSLLNVRFYWNADAVAVVVVGGFFLGRSLLIIFFFTFNWVVQKTGRKNYKLKMMMTMPITKLHLQSPLYNYWQNVKLKCKHTLELNCH